MVRYFKKEIPSNPLFLPNGRKAPFHTCRSGVGILATDDALLVDQLSRAAAHRVGGVIEIRESDYSALHSAPNAHFESTPSSGIDQLYVRWKIAKGRFKFQPRDSGARKVGRIFHVVERHEISDPDSYRRVMRAFDSWVYLYEQGVIPRHFWFYPRDSRGIGDSRNLPYLKDALRFGMEGAEAEDVLMLTNDDAILHQKILPKIHEMMSRVDACSSFRMNFNRGKVPATDTPIHAIKKCGAPCLGRDLFCFRIEWLRRNWDWIPDFILGEMEWDLVMSVMIRLAAGAMTTKINYDRVEPLCEIERGYVIHENHHRDWTDEKYAVAPAKLHNNSLMAEWNSDNGFENLIGKLL